MLAACLCLGFVLAMAPAARGEPARRLGQNPRGLAMGATGVSYADDEMALYYNPAGLGSIQGWWVELAPLVAEGSPRAFQLINDPAARSFDDPTRLLEENLGKDIYLRGFAYPTAVVNLAPRLTLGVGYFNEVQASLEIHNRASPEVRGLLRQDEGSALGLSLPLKPEGFQLGVGLRFIRRRQFQGDVNLIDLALAALHNEIDLQQLVPETSGRGIAYDVGLIAPVEGIPGWGVQTGVVVQNVGGVNLGDAGRIPQEASLGLSFYRTLPPRVPLHLALELRDLTGTVTTDKSFLKRTHVGAELGILPMDRTTNLLTLRAGLGSGNLSYGIELAAWHYVSVQYVVYYQEYGNTARDDPRLRRLWQVTLGGF